MPTFPEPDSARLELLSSPAHFRKQGKRKSVLRGQLVFRAGRQS